MSTSVRDYLTSAMDKGYLASKTGLVLDEHGNPADYDYDFATFCVNHGFGPAEGLAFQAGYFAHMYASEYFPEGMQSGFA